MSLKNAQFTPDATGYTMVGGTAISFAPVGNQPNNGVLLGITTDPYKTRRTLSYRNNEPTRDATKASGMTQKRSSAMFTQPFVNALGVVEYNTVKLEIAYSINATTTHVTELLNMATQLGHRGDFTDIVKTGNPA